MGDHTTIRGCRGCGGQDLVPVIDLGRMPLADALLGDDQQIESEQRYPLTVVFCDGCTLVQILETVPPDVLYPDDYPYYSSFSDALVEHARRNVDGLIDRYGVDEDSLVVELASNDGYLLQWFAARGIPVLGIDPAAGPAQAATDRGVPTMCEFFGPYVAERLVAEGTRADVVVGNNVLAHVPDQNVFVASIREILTPTGSVVMEFPYVKDLVDRCEFDTIYHEHHCYFSVTSVRALFERHGLHLTEVEHLDIHGGSLRAHFSAAGEPEESVARFLASEIAEGVTERSYYADFADRVRGVGAALVELLDDLRSDGSTIAGYGAAAKGAMMLNYSGVGRERIDYVVDRNVHKHGKLMPGAHLPIVGPERLETDPPDYLLLLAWNFREEIVRQQAAFADAGGRFIVPVPHPTVLETSRAGEGS